MKLTPVHTNTTTYFIKLEEAELKAAIAEYIAREADIKLTSEHVSHRVVIGKADTSYGFYDYAEITITQDWNKVPEPC